MDLTSRNQKFPPLFPSDEMNSVDTGDAHILTKGGSNSNVYIIAYDNEDSE